MSEAPLMTIEQVADYLQLKVKTLYAMAQGIPHYRVGRLIRFRKEDIDAWLEEHKSIGGEIVPPKKMGRCGVRKTGADALVRKAIDEVKRSSYTSPCGKSDRIKSLGKEK